MNQQLGSRPAVEFPNPEALEVEYLRDAWGTRNEPYKPAAARISKDHPSEALAKDSPGQTAIQVQLEFGGTAAYPVLERNQIRFTVHGDKNHRTEVLRVATITQALIFTQRTPGVAATRLIGGRSDVITDPDTGNLMVWFLAEISTNAIPLES